jgi:glycosyltransferase involved in cell wall biosynthesis
VIHVVLSLDCGGLERIVLDLVTQGIALGQEVGVVCVERAGSLAAEVRARGGWVASAGKPPGIKPGTFLSLSRLFHHHSAAVIHTHQIGPLLYAGPAALTVSGAAVVHTEHGKYYEGAAHKRPLGRIAALFASRFFCVSEDIAQSVLAHRIAPPRKVSVIRNGIDTEQLARRDPAATSALRNSLGIPEQSPVIGTVGRLDEIKRQDLLLRAFACVRSSVPCAHLVIVGDGPQSGQLQDLAAELGLEGSCHFTGYQNQPARYYQLFDVFALTSRSEGAPLAVLEAGAAGIPVVASRVGGLPEIIQDGHTGILFEPGDEEALVTALRSLIENQNRAQTLGRAAHDRIDGTYALERMARDYHQHYLSVAGID